MTYINNYNYQGRNINPPLTYPKLQGVMFFLPISYSRACELIGKEISPIRISPQKALLGLTIFDFIDSPVGPYREMALTIPVSLNNPFKPSFVPLIFQKTLNKYFALYTVMLGMNTLHGQKHASQIFGYPIYDDLLDIDFNFNDRYVEVTVKENGDNILTFKINVNKGFKKHERFYKTIFRTNDGMKLVNLSALTNESSTYMNRLLSFKFGKHDIANKIIALEPLMFSLQTSFYKNAVETLSNPKDIQI